jgi:two-component system, cell cycle sensor histidine kinase and response regulator CckA
MPKTIDGSDVTTILVAEDEVSLQIFLCATLNRAGYSVLVAFDGQGALNLARKHDGAIDLLLTDFKMPGITGVELARQIRMERPGIKVMLISGYSGDIQTRDEDGFAFLEKPFTPNELLQHIIKLLCREIRCPLCEEIATQMDAANAYCVDCDYEWEYRVRGRNSAKSDVSRSAAY